MTLDEVEKLARAVARAASYMRQVEGADSPATRVLLAMNAPGAFEALLTLYRKHATDEGLRVLGLERTP